MNHGILVRANGDRATWTWGDSTCQNPIEYLLQPGDQLLDLSIMTEDEQLTFIDLIRQTQGPARNRLLASVPTVLVPDVPPAPDGHITCIQPGYRRICYRPTQEWHQEEMRARLVSNQRIRNGEPESKVIDEEFTHLTKEEKQLRKDMKNGAEFPLTPMVVLVEKKKQLLDGTEIVETLRQFAFHEPVSKF